MSLQTSITVFFAFCSWEDAKLLLMRENFFQDLVFYDKDKISDDLFRKLEKFSQSAESSPEFLLEISKAASSLSVWIRAVYNYCNVLHTFKPKQEEMKEAEKRLNQVGFVAIFSASLIFYERSFEFLHIFSHPVTVSQCMFLNGQF